MKRGQNNQGFTIVELLIVIIVIGILAAITLVAYNGVQRKARNAQTLAAVKTYERVLRLYAVDTGSFPTAFGACLGANYPSNNCWTGPNGNFSVDAAMDTALQPYASRKPVVATKPLTITNVNDVRLGALYRYTSATDIKIIYYLEGTGQTCLHGSAGTTEMEGTQCALVLAS